MNNKEKTRIEEGLAKLCQAFPTQHPTKQTWTERGITMKRWEWGLRNLRGTERTK